MACESKQMNLTAISIVTAGALVAGALLYTSGSFDKLLAPPFETALRNHFVDPESVQIRDSFKDGARWCGEVNAKNRMGGYVGWDRFIAVDGRRTDGRWTIIIASEFTTEDGRNGFERLYCSR